MDSPSPPAPPQFSLNTAQTEAIHHIKGPLLVVAGAGSGKTRVIVEKIQHLVNTGIKPFTILAITFTNKAAKTMSTRVAEYGIEGPWVCTFHSMCVRILKKEAQHLGLSEQFSIFDGDDQVSVVKSVLKEMDLDPAEWKPRALLGQISRFKNNGQSVEEVHRSADDFRTTVIAKAYDAYEKSLATNQALDFDDLLLKTLQLFREHEHVLENYRKRFNYILVDEYQDTNEVQYQLIQVLAPGAQGLTLTGDPDQSIYSWRGANIHNILNFERDFKDAHIVKMETNYRSRRHILELANQLIRHNRERYEKDAITDNPDGPVPILHQTQDSQSEADLIADIIAKYRANGRPYCDVAVFYRTNQQSRSIEEGLRRRGIPYILVGGTRFFERKEIKDLIAYLRFIHNPADSISLMRIVNLPSRGIGESLKSKIRDFADDNGLNVWQAMMSPDFSTHLPKRSKSAIEKFNQLVASFFELSFARPDLLVERIIQETRFEDLFKSRSGDIEEDRVDNVREFMAYVTEFSNKNPSSNLGTLLEEISLIGDKKQPGEEDPLDFVTLMTLHGSKGLEFPYVLFAGLDEGLCPHQRSIDEGTAPAIEEERRLCYVGITRAEEELHLFTANERMGYKGPMRCKPSRFISEIEGEHLEKRKNGRSLKPRLWIKPKGSGVASSRPLRKGSPVRHPRYGKGIIMDLDGGDAPTKARVYFDRQGEKTIHLEFDPLEAL